MNKRAKIGLIAGIAALVLVVGVILLVVLLPENAGDDSEYTATEYHSVESTVDESGVRTVSVPLSESGEILDNTIGTLIDLYPSYLKKISLENQSGNYQFTASTDSDGATSYVLVGFEGYDLNNTNAALIGSAISSLDMASIVSATDENAADYGLDNPKVVASADFTDGSSVTLYIGDDAAGATYTYVQLEGCDAIFTVLKSDIEALLLNLNDMFNLSIRSDYSTVSDEDFTSITLGGTHLDTEVTIKHAEDGSLEGYYVLTSHDDAPVNTTVGSDIMGSVKSLYAASVAFANPDSNTLKELGLDKPYATVKAEYVYTETDADTEETTEKTLSVSMLATEPDDEGNVYLMDEGGKLVYTIAADSVDWVSVTLSDLRSEYVFAPSYSAIKGMTVSQGDVSYYFTVETVITESVDEDGEETSTSETVVKYGDKSIDEAYFRVLFEDLAYIPVRGEAASDDKSSDELLVVTYEYNTGRAADTVVYYATDSQKVIPEANGSIDSYIYKADIDGIFDNAKALSEGKEIDSIA